MDQREQELSAFVAARSTSLLRTAYLLTGDQSSAEDLLQSALVKVFLSWDRIRDRERLEAYTRTVLVRTQVSWWRRPARRENAIAEVPEQPGPDDRSDLAERDELWRLLATLGKRQRAVLVLRYYEDLPEAEIARVLDCSVGTVKSQLHRGLARMRERLTEPVRETR